MDAGGAISQQQQLKGAWADQGMLEDLGFVHPVKKLCLRDAASPDDDPFLSQEGEHHSQLPDLNVAHQEDQSLLVAPARPDQTRSAAGSSSTSLPSLDCLGDDLLLHVLRMAQPTAWDLCRLACVNRAWRDACYNRIFWTKLRVGSGSMRPGVESLASRCTDLMELHIDDPRCELYVLHPIVVACGNSLRRVAINCDMDSSNRNEASICSILWIISLYCKNVDTVELLSEGTRGGFGYLENKALWYLTTGFRNIRSFASLCQESITKQSLYLMVIAWRDLTCLRIHCGLLGQDDLTSLRKCHALRVLELVGGRLGAIVGDPATSAPEKRGPAGKDLVIHSRLEVVVLSDIICEPHDVVALSQQCPGLRRVLLSRGSWAHGSSSLHLARQRSQFKLLQTWLHMAKSVELLIED